MSKQLEGIPLFPNFKPLELSDRESIEQFTAQFPPYSDFNFTSMWCWDIQGKTRLSNLNDNLVVRFSDYLDTHPFYSFLGIVDVNGTSKSLLDLSKREGLKEELKLIPEDSIKDLDTSIFNVQEERDNFDYIYEVENLIKMSGSKFGIKRKHLRFFEKTFLHEVKVLDFCDSEVRKDFVDLFNNWGISKNVISTDYFKNEFTAASRLFHFTETKNFFVVGVYSEGKLIAASITEDVNTLHNLGHFQKSLVKPFKGLNDRLINELAKMLGERAIKYMNFEQDLGLPGLRESKESYLPCAYLKKFSLSLK